MAKIVVINRFDGGMAEDIRTTASNECEYSLNFDIATNEHSIAPYSDPVAEVSTGTITDYQITDVVTMTPASTSGPDYIYALGRTSLATNTAAIFKKASRTDITDSWGSPVVSAAAGIFPQKGGLTEYKGFLYFFGGDGQFHKFTSPATLTNIAGTSSYYSNEDKKMFRHPYDDSLYFYGGSKVYKYDAVTYTTPTELHDMGSNNQVISLCDFGTDLAIATTMAVGPRRSYVYLSNKDITTPQEKPRSIITWGTEQMAVIANIAGSIVGISYTENQGTFNTVVQNKFFIKISNGGAPQTVKEILVDSTANIRIFKDKLNDRLYFGYDGDTNIWVIGKNKLGNWYVTKDRYITPTGTAVTTLDGISFVGDIAFISNTNGGTAGYLSRQGTSTAYTLPSVYTTIINPGMESGSSMFKKVITKVRVSYTVNTTGGTVGVLMRKDSESSYTSVISQSQSTTGKFVTEATSFADYKPMEEGHEFQFQLTSIGNVSIEGLEYEYEVTNK